MQTFARLPLLAAAAALLALPAAAPAEQVAFGSSLAGTPDVLHENNKADTLFFNVTAKNSHRTPVSGEILAIRVKGKIFPHPSGVDNNNLWHSQVLRPNGDSTYTVDSSSQHLYFPVGGSEQDVHTFVPSTQCIKRGEYVDFNHVGGWNGDAKESGTKYQIFKSDRDSQMNWYERDNGTNIGATFAPNQQRDTAGNATFSNGFQPDAPLPEELMMQVVVGTGFDSSNLCEGGLKGYEYFGVQVQKTAFTVYDDGVAGARVACTSGRGYCDGTARLELDGVELGRTSFKIERNVTTNLDIPLTNEGARVVNAKGVVDAKVLTDSRDDIGQQRATTGEATLRSARPGGFAGTSLRPQSAAVKNGAFSITATCPLGTAGACTGTISVSSQKRVALRRGTRGKVYKMAAGRFTIEPGKKVRIPLKLTSAGRKVMRKVKSVVAIATVTTSEAGGRPVAQRSKVTLKRK